ncbi:hypothetical protein QBC47DRAFT_432331 [Echria macrotheca]|uniref:Uncharacterized protein n=1 Tax=Echria macrotheca TaxID=438768 RepID=A0AAJ0B6P1_9PEZI|nr:hypothetical protein QBC47DRAFT_432331 [Echria macrotheca]
MAVIDNVPGVEVTVECDGKALDEYDTGRNSHPFTQRDFHLPKTLPSGTNSNQPHELPLAQKDIEAKPGKRFGFRIKLQFPDATMNIAVPEDLDVYDKILESRNLDCGVGYDNIACYYSQRAAVDPVFTDEHQRSFARFEFDYRTMDSLIRAGIVPQNRAISVTDEVRAMTEDQVRKLAEKFLEQQRASRSAVTGNTKTTPSHGSKRNHEDMLTGDAEPETRRVTRRMIRRRARGDDNSDKNDN